MAHGNEEGGGRAALPERVLAPLVRVCGAVSAGAIVGAVGLTVYSVVMRYVFETPPLWIDEVTGWLLIALIFAGVTEAYRRGDHIAIDLLTGGLTGARRRLAALWADLSVLGFAVVLGLSTWEAIEFNRSFGAWTNGAVEIEAWIPQAPMLFGAVLLGLLALARLTGRLTGGAR